MKKALMILAAAALLQGCSVYKGNITGVVYADGKPLKGALVSDGSEIVKTDAHGRYSILSSKKDSTVFVITPSGYTPQLKDSFRPDFWAYLTEGQEVRERHDFHLSREDQSRYGVIFLPDLHLVNDARRDDIRRFGSEIIPFLQQRAAELGEGGAPVYSINLGDLTHEVYWYEFGFREDDAVALMDSLRYPAKMYSVTGNHDHDGAVVGSETDFRSAWLYRRCWGPDRYSVNIGNEHWVLLDNIFYVNVPGKGKKAPGINGDRSYADSLTRAQLEWLAKDLEQVPSDRNVIFCMHCPPFAGTGKNYLPLEQISAMDSLAARFDKPAKVFAGHVHKFDFYKDPRFPHLEQYALTCASGVMWETRRDMPLVGGDGADAGLMLASYEGDKEEYHLHSYAHGERYFRVYDMNEVGRAYAASGAVKRQQELFGGKRRDYSQPEYANCVYVNYWGFMPGDEVQMLEDGKPLKVTRTRNEDPVHNFAYDLYMIESPRAHHSPKASASCIHMFTARAASATTPVTVRILRDGKLLHEQTVQRPKAFTLDCK